METAPAEPTAPISDEELAGRIGRGDTGAFEALMRRHNRRLYRVARAILNDDGDAEDALQEAYLAAYQRIGTFQAKSTLSTWLTRIVVNAALQRLRTSKRQRVVVPLIGAERDEENDIMTTSDGTKPATPERAAMRAEMRRLLEREIDNLPVAFRTVLILREVEEMSVEEAAECLDVPAATVRTRLFRAKAQLREALAREVGLATEGVYGFAGARCDRIVAWVLARIGTTRGNES